MSSLVIFDAILAVVLVVIGWGVLMARDLFQSIVLFIVFGMLLGLAWCRLNALDVALAEVAIGAGLTGALLLNTLASTRGRAVSSTSTTSSAETPAAAFQSPGPTQPLAQPIARAIAILLFATVAAGGLAIAVIPLARSEVAPRIAIAATLPDSGADNPVTAVLLNFRAYDTLMEVGVLLAAVFSVHAVSVPIAQTRPQRVGRVLTTFARLMVPLAVLVATYFLWVGAKQPGGAFQAAAILAAGGVLIVVSGGSAPRCVKRRWRLLLVGGLGVFLLVGLLGMAWGGNFLELSPQWAGGMILVVETALTISMALILIVLFGSTSQGQDEFGPVAVEKQQSPVGDSPAPTGNEVQEPSP